MSAVATSKASEAYSEKFDNLAEVSLPAICFTPEFGALLQKAIDRGTPLTQAEVDQEFGPQSWEW
jgi:hypothetical protein